MPGLATSRAMIALTLLGIAPWIAARAEDSFFESQVRPLLVARCYECHSGTKTSGGLALDSREGWQQGGDSGPVIVPGKPEESRLILAVRYTDPNFLMPPKNKGQLPDAEIAALSKWIADGARDPRTAGTKLGGMTPDDAKSWWAFQPLPVTKTPLSPARIDAIVDQKRAAQALPPSPPADRRTLIRRATYDLTGLPPTPAEVDAFLADPSPDAFEQVVERLLASPQYGVQWGRHWLDVVRYADTAGENTDRPLPHAWRYRNWVFDAFNHDLPYDQFVRLQLAGDIIRAAEDDSRRNEGIVATGYLAIARRFGHDIDKDIHLMHEDVLDNLGKNFLGITIGCARCHDHKYDPVTAQDYYALYGIFNSSRFAFPGCEPKGQPRDLVPLMSPDKVAALMDPWRERSARADAEKKRHQESVASAQERIRMQSAQSTNTLSAAQVGEGASVAFSDGKRGPLERIAVRKGEILQLTVFPHASHGADTTVVDWTIREIADLPRQWSVADLVHNLTQANPRTATDGSSWCLYENTNGPSFFREPRDAINGHAALKSWSFGSEPSVFVNSADQPVTVWTTLPAKSFFVHPGPNRPVAVAWVSPLDGVVSVRGSVADAHPSGGDGVAFQLDHMAAVEIGPALTHLGNLSSKTTMESDPPPVIPVAYAVVEAVPRNARLQQAGDPERLGEEIPRRWLSVFGSQAVPNDDGSGRRLLADWVSRHPLAARVMANRIWQWHFSQGLVRTPNDFGSRGDRATHPELLDELAAQFVASGYSIKAMHRLIMGTATYQRSSAATVAADPDNRLLAHFPRRRLSAEELRDSLLVASGNLDPTPAQAHPFPPESSWTFTQHNPFNAVYDTNQRSAYLMVQRQRRHPFLALFDGADPNASTPVRQTTTVPTQALYFLNDPFFHAQSTDLAVSLLAIPDDDSRFQQIFRRLLQRDPTVTEQARGRDFLASYPASPEEQWSAYARVLLASNEFLHLD